nr:unnamed protein product [Digitaria exilis]
MNPCGGELNQEGEEIGLVTVLPAHLLLLALALVIAAWPRPPADALGRCPCLLLAPPPPQLAARPAATSTCARPPPSPAPALGRRPSLLLARSLACARPPPQPAARPVTHPRLRPAVAGGAGPPPARPVASRCASSAAEDGACDGVEVVAHPSKRGSMWVRPLPTHIDPLSKHMVDDMAVSTTSERSAVHIETRGALGRITRPDVRRRGLASDGVSL